MANFPTSKDDSTSLPNPTSVSTQANPDHAGLHTAENAAIIALETKVGTGSSTPASSTLLIGTGAGTSAWSALTSAQLAAVLSDETGTGSAVFATTPTLVTPKVDTINENTPGNGVTLAGMNVKSGILTNPSTAIGANGVTAANLATNAITLGYAQITADVTNTAPTSAQAVTGLSVTVTIPSGGRRIKITVFARYVFGTAAAPTIHSLWDGTVGSGTQLQTHQFGNVLGQTQPLNMIAIPSAPAAGSKTYNVGVTASSGNIVTGAAATSPAFILVEAI